VRCVEDADTTETFFSLPLAGRVGERKRAGVGVLKNN
jgi:hypothetical protein